jgi:hypothetical protein
MNIGYSHEQQSVTSSSNSPAQRFLGKPVEQRQAFAQFLDKAVKGDAERYSVPKFLSNVTVFLQDTDKDVLLSALTICCDVKDDNDDRKAFLKGVGPQAVNIFLRNKDEDIRKQAIKVVLISSKCDGIVDADLGRMFVTLTLVHFADHHPSLLKLFDDTLWKKAADDIKAVVGEAYMREVKWTIMTAILSIKRLANLLITSFGNGLSDPIKTKLLESIAIQVVRRRWALQVGVEKKNAQASMLK